MAGNKHESGRWRIDPAELSRWMDANPVLKRSENQNETPHETSGNGMSAEVRMLREQIGRLTAERDRERGQLVDQIEDLRGRLDGAEAARTKLQAVLTDQRDRRGLWARLLG